jgi:hypothetical protein
MDVRQSGLSLRGRVACIPDVSWRMSGALCAGTGAALRHSHCLRVASRERPARQRNRPAATGVAHWNVASDTGPYRLYNRSLLL